MAVDTLDWLDVLFKFIMITLGTQYSVFIVSVLMKSEVLFEVTGVLTFTLLAYLSCDWSGKWNLPRNTLQTAMIVIWSLRLGLFLFVRALRNDGDVRFETFRNNPCDFFIAWTIQGAWVFITMLPTLLLNLQTSDKVIPLGFRDHLGWSLFCIGFVIEVVADYQKTKFRNNPDNKNKFITSGLWSISRHPNFCGDLLIWFGLYLAASSELTGYQLLVVFCPMLDYLIIAFISGIEPLERHGLAKWGKQRSYQEYLKNTPVLFPFYTSLVKSY